MHRPQRQTLTNVSCIAPDHPGDRDSRSAWWNIHNGHIYGHCGTHRCHWQTQHQAARQLLGLPPQEYAKRSYQSYAAARYTSPDQRTHVDEMRFDWNPGAPPVLVHHRLSHSPPASVRRRQASQTRLAQPLRHQHRGLARTHLATRAAPHSRGACRRRHRGNHPPSTLDHHRRGLQIGPCHRFRRHHGHQRTRRQGRFPTLQLRCHHRTTSRHLARPRRQMAPVLRQHGAGNRAIRTITHRHHHA